MTSAHIRICRGEGPFRKGGFTLFEVVVAMAILCCFTVAICSLQAMAFHGTDQIYHYVLADQVLGSLVEDIRYNIQSLPNVTSGTTTLGGINFTWTVKIADDADVHLQGYSKEVTLHCVWSDSSGTHDLTRHSIVVFPEVADPPPDANALSAELPLRSVGITFSPGRIPWERIET